MEDKIFRKTMRTLLLTRVTDMQVSRAGMLEEDMVAAVEREILMSVILMLEGIEMGMQKKVGEGDAGLLIAMFCLGWQDSLALEGGSLRSHFEDGESQDYSTTGVVFDLS